jgi:hypothetical protein
MRDGVMPEPGDCLHYPLRLSVGLGDSDRGRGPDSPRLLRDWTVDDLDVKGVKPPT